MYRKKYWFFVVILQFLLTTYAFSQRINYPFTPIINVTDTIHGQVINDEYRWLENTSDLNVIKWIKAENALTDSCIKRAASQIDSYRKIDKYSYAEYSNPRKKDGYYFSYAFYDNLGSPALFYRKEINDQPMLLVDPNFISLKDNISLRDYAVSKNGKLLAYQFSRNGSDLVEIKVVSLQTHFHKTDHLMDAKFSSISWKDDGFFYSRSKDKGFEASMHQEIYYHKIGTDQSQDSLIFKRAGTDKLFYASTTDDERFLLITEEDKKTDLSNIYYVDYMSTQNKLMPLLTRFSGLSIIDNIGDDFFAFSTGKNNGRLIKFSLQNPRKWIEVIPEYKSSLLLGVKLLEEKIITLYQSNGKQQIIIFNYNAEVLYAMDLPAGCSAGNISVSKGDKEMIFSYNSYVHPPVVYSFNLQSYDIKPNKATVVNFDYKQFETKELQYSSKDGTIIPLLILYKKGTKLDAENLLLLNTYGGFGSIETPTFDPALVHFLFSGGIYAYANIRGGGDFGIEWAEKGQGKFKQNSFDDFISAAQFLIDNKYTKASKLAITGASNGGLVVCAAMIQRPDLFKVAVPVVSPCDMIRFEKFTVGNFHTDEYGSISDSSGFKNLYSYSPLHNIKEDVNYPATLIMTSDNDDRVPPFHSYKFAARLQNRKAQTNPVLLRVEKNAGHYGAQSDFLGVLEEEAAMYDFILYNLNH
ncbi:MAG: hypothetical protein K0S44_500 [Bacteroidetes bacterium]|jgi:prolyl oligopeptidase|nr:hypothetical protein [Bacteroidota bacterium]